MKGAKEKPPAASTAAQGGQGNTSHTHEPSPGNDAGQGLADLYEVAERSIFVPYKLVKKDNGKTDKVPSNGQHNLSYTRPADLLPMLDAVALVNEWKGLKGIGIVFEGGIVHDGWQLIGLDYDGVDFDRFRLPVVSYAECSPSGKGIHQLAWVPVAWAAKYAYTGGVQLADCHHAEVYLTSRFLTASGDKLNDLPIHRLTDAELTVLESWGLNPFEAPSALPSQVDIAGTKLDLAKFNLTPDQRKLVNGTEGIDRSKVMMGFIITLLDSGAAQEDILATLLHTPPLWKYLMDHREDNADKAHQFAKDEINRAYPKSAPAKREKLIGFNEKWKADPVAASTVPEVSPTFPAQIYDSAPGLVGEIARHVMKASRAPRKEFAYATALSVIACLTGPYCTSSGGTLNLYIALVGGTGTGKTEAMKAGLKLLSATDAQDSVSDFPASEAALRRQLVVNPNVLIRVDELAHKFESFKGDSSNGSGLSRAILEAYDGDRMPPKAYADDKKSLPAVENPFVQILGGTTDKVWQVFQTKHLEDGTLNRFIFVCLPDEPAYSANPSASDAIEKTFKDKLNAFFRAGRMRDLIGNMPGFGRCIDFAPEVDTALEALGPELFKKQQGEYGALYSRFVLHVGKIAALLAIGDGRKLVSMTDYQQALAFMAWSVETTLHKVSGTLAGSDFERKTKRIARKLEKAKGKKMSMRDLYRYMTCSRKDMEALIEVMELSGTVSKDKEDWVSLLG